jgi:hypothetical protein
VGRDTVIVDSKAAPQFSVSGDVTQELPLRPCSGP